MKNQNTKIAFHGVAVAVYGVLMFTPIWLPFDITLLMPFGAFVVVSIVSLFMICFHGQQMAISSRNKELKLEQDRKNSEHDLLMRAKEFEINQKRINSIKKQNTINEIKSIIDNLEMSVFYSKLESAHVVMYDYDTLHCDWLEYVCLQDLTQEELYKVLSEALSVQVELYNKK